MNKSIIIPLLTTLLGWTGFAVQVNAQTDNELLAELVAENEEAIHALVLYPEDVREAILEATLYPEALIRLESIQSKTSDSFRILLENYPQTTQEMIWDLTRYPDLIHQLAAGGKPSDSRIQAILSDYPDIIHERARTAARDYYYQLVAIDELNRNANGAFEELLSAYPVVTSESLRKLISLPEVLSILTDNIRLTVLVGDLYRKDPAQVRYLADSMNLEVSRQNAEELQDWKESLKKDPVAMSELKASTEAFEEEYGYDDDYYEYESDDLYYDNEIEEVVVREYYYYNYPYWFGYPYWYYYPRWRPYPYWYESGFYFYPGGTIVILNLPSFYFTHWYFYQPHHHHNWPHLSAHFANHYYGHRHVGSSITTSVNQWRDQNREIVTDQWLRDDGKLADRFREYGDLETKRIKYNQDHPQRTVTREEYLEKNKTQYPSMERSLEESRREPVIRDRKVEPGDNKAPVRDRKTEPVIREPVEKDRKTVPPTVKPPEKEPVRPKTEQKPTVPKRKNDTAAPVQKVPEGKRTPEVDKGREYHKNTWERTKKTSPTPQVSPKTKTTTPRTKVPKTNPKTRKNNTGRKNDSLG